MIAGPVEANGMFNGTAGAAGTGVTLSAPLSFAHANAAALRYLGSGITLTAPLSLKHAEGANARSLGSGVTLTAPLRGAHAAGATVTDPGTGIGVTPAIRRARPAGTPASNEAGVGVEMFATGGSATMKSLDVWQMRSAW